MKALALLWRALDDVNWIELVRNVQENLSTINAQQPIDNVEILKSDLPTAEQLKIDRIKLRSRSPVDLDECATYTPYLRP